MIPDLHISKLESCLCDARLSDCSVNISEPTLHATIAEALRFICGDVPENFVHFVDVHYSGVSSGTIGTARLATEGEAAAARLVKLVVALYRSEEDLAHRRQAQASAASD